MRSESEGYRAHGGLLDEIYLTFHCDYGLSMAMELQGIWQEFVTMTHAVTISSPAAAPTPALRNLAPDPAPPENDRGQCDAFRKIFHAQGGTATSTSFEGRNASEDPGATATTPGDGAGKADVTGPESAARRAFDVILRAMNPPNAASAVHRALQKPGEDSGGDELVQDGKPGSKSVAAADDKKNDADKKDGAGLKNPGLAPVEAETVPLAVLVAAAPVSVPVAAAPSPQVAEKEPGKAPGVKKQVPPASVMQASGSASTGKGRATVTTDPPGLAPASGAVAEKASALENIPAAQGQSDAAPHGSASPNLPVPSPVSGAGASPTGKTGLSEAVRNLRGVEAALKLAPSSAQAALQPGVMTGPVAGPVAALGAAAKLDVPQGTSAQAGPIVSASPYTRMDQGAAPIMLHSGVQQVAVGVQDSSLGWVEIRAQNVSGHVDATLLTASGQTHDSLASQLPAMAQFVAQRDVQLGALAVRQQASAGLSNGFGGAGNSGGAGYGTGHGTGHGTGQGTGQGNANPGGGFTGGFGNPQGGFYSPHRRPGSRQSLRASAAASERVSQISYENSGDGDVGLHPFSYINLRA